MPFVGHPLSSCCWQLTHVLVKDQRAREKEQRRRPKQGPSTVIHPVKPTNTHTHKKGGNVLFFRPTYKAGGLKRNSSPTPWWDRPPPSPSSCSLKREGGKRDFPTRRIRKTSKREALANYYLLVRRQSVASPQPTGRGCRQSNWTVKRKKAKNGRWRRARVPIVSCHTAVQNEQTKWKKEGQSSRMGCIRARAPLCRGYVFQPVRM